MDVGSYGDIFLTLFTSSLTSETDSVSLGFIDRDGMWGPKQCQWCLGGAFTPTRGKVLLEHNRKKEVIATGGQPSRRLMGNNTSESVGNTEAD